MWIDFEKWKTDGEQVLASIWQNIGWEYPAGATKAALSRSERHKNRPESYQIVSSEVIKQELGATY